MSWKLRCYRLIALVYGMLLVYVVFFARRRKLRVAMDRQWSGALFYRKWQLVSQKGIFIYDKLHYEMYQDFFGNLLLLAPFPIGVYYWRGIPWKLKSLMIFLMLVSIAIESIQYLFNIGVADIDDVVLNVVGGILGWYLWKKCCTLLPFLEIDNHQKV